MAEDRKPERKPEAKPETKIEFVNMVRDPEVYPAPHKAVVHPFEVDNYRVGGWITEDDLRAVVERKRMIEKAKAEK